MRTFDAFLEEAMNEAVPLRARAGELEGRSPSNVNEAVPQVTFADVGSGERLEDAVTARVAAATAQIALRVSRPAWAEALCVELPCSEDGLKQAFRRRAFETHPDRPGGSHEAFLAVRAAQEEGLAAIRDGGGIARPARIETRAPRAPSWTRYGRPSAPTIRPAHVAVG